MPNLTAFSGGDVWRSHVPYSDGDVATVAVGDGLVAAGLCVTLVSLARLADDRQGPFSYLQKVMSLTCLVQLIMQAVSSTLLLASPAHHPAAFSYVLFPAGAVTASIYDLALVTAGVERAMTYHNRDLRGVKIFLGLSLLLLLVSPAFFFYLRPGGGGTGVEPVRDGFLPVAALELLFTLMLDYLPVAAVAPVALWVAIVRRSSSKEDHETTRVFLYQALFFLLAQSLCLTVPWFRAKVLIETARYAFTMLIYQVVVIRNLYQ